MVWTRELPAKSRFLPSVGMTNLLSSEFSGMINLSAQISLSAEITHLSAQSFFGQNDTPLSTEFSSVGVINLIKT